MNIVLDTNILVSALWKPAGNASLILSHVIAGDLQVCYDYRIMEEYRDVLLRPKFRFSPASVKILLDYIACSGLSIVAPPLPDILMPDEDDRPFYEVARACNALLITGNARDFPADTLIVTPSEFLARYSGNITGRN